MDIGDIELCVLSGTTPELLQSSKAVQFLPDNRIVICCSDIILIMEVYMDLNPERLKSNSDSLAVYLQRSVLLSELKPFAAFVEGMVDLVSSTKSHRDGLGLSQSEAQLFITDPSLCIDRFLSRYELGSFYNAKSSPCYAFNDILISVVTYDHTAFILMETQGKWKVFLSLNDLVKDVILRNRQEPMILGKNLSFDQYKDIMLGMSVVETAWSSVFHMENEKTELNDDFLLLFSGMRNGDLHIWQVKLPLSNRENCIHLKTEKSVSEISALIYHSINNFTGYLCVGFLTGNIKIFHVHFQEKLDLNQVFDDHCEDFLSVQDFASTVINGSHILTAAKQYFLLFYLLQGKNKPQLIKSLHLDCSSPIGSLSADANTVCASTEDGFIFDCNITVPSDQIISIDLKQRTSKLSGACCAGLSFSTNGAFSISAFQPSNVYHQAMKRSKWRDWQKVILSLSRTFSVDALIEKNFQSPSCVQDAIVHFCLYFQQKFEAKCLEQHDQITLQKLCKSENLEILQLARSLALHLKFKFLSNLNEEDCKSIGIDENFDSEKLGKRILTKHVLSCLHSSSTIKSNDVVLDNFSSILKWVENFCDDSESQELLRKAGINIWQKSCSDTNFIMKCCICDNDFKHYDGLLSFVCVKGHKTKLSCLTLSPVFGLNVRKCFSCGSNAENLRSLSLLTFLKDKTHCTLCRGHLKQCML